MLTTQVQTGEDLVGESGFLDRSIYSGCGIILAPLLFGLDIHRILQGQRPKVIVKVKELEVPRFAQAAGFNFCKGLAVFGGLREEKGCGLIAGPGLLDGIFCNVHNIWIVG